MTVKRRKWIYAAAFLVPVALFAVVMALRRIVPFGDSTLLLWDADGQYISFLSAWRRVLLGEADALYTLSRDLGGSMAGLTAYYLASPLNVLLALFPQTHIIEAVELIILLKIGLCGLFMALYLVNSRGLGADVVLFSTAYALMGFIACYFWDVMWLDGVALLPLIVWGIERLVSGRGGWLYVPALALALFSNYYIGYMLCLFSVLYFLYVWLEHRKETPFLRTAFRFCASSILAAGLSAVMLVPAFCALAKGYGMPGANALSLDRRFPMIELLTKLLTGAVDYEQVRSNGLPALYVGIPVLMLMGTYFLDSTLGIRRRVMAALLLLLFAFSFQNQTLYILWHAFDSPNAMPARFSFLCSFWMILLAAEARRRLPRIPKETLHKRLCWLAAGAFAAGCIVLREELPYYLSDMTVTFDAVCMLCSCALIAMLVSSGISKRRLAISGLCILQAVCLILNGYLSIRRLNVIDTFRADAYRQEMAIKQPLFDELTSQNGVYRIETNAARTENDSLQYGYAGLSHYSSDVQNTMTLFFRKLGQRQSPPRFHNGNGLTPVAESLLGVKYIVWDVTDALAQTPYQGYQAVDQRGDLIVYENPYALPLAMMVPSAQTYDPLASEDPFVNQNALLSDWIGGEWVDALEAVHDVTRSVEGTTMHVAFQASAAQNRYLITSGTWFAWNGSGMEPFSRFASCVPVPLADQAVTLDAYVGDSYETPVFHLAQLNTEVFEQAMAALSAQACEVSSETDSAFQVRAHATAEHSQLLFTLPYDAGWQLWVDGQRQETCARYGILLAAELTPGDHEVELRYVPKGLVPGAAISVLSLVIAAWLVWNNQKKRIRAIKNRA